MEGFELITIKKPRIKPKSNKICSAPNCTNRASDDGISLHQFPSDKKYHALWARLFRIRIVTKNDFACNLHFEPSCFFPVNQFSSRKCKRKLKKDAIPTLNLPDRRYAKSKNARTREMNKINRIKTWRLKNNKDISILPMIDFPPDESLEGLLPLEIHESDNEENQIFPLNTENVTCNFETNEFSNEENDDQDSNIQNTPDTEEQEKPCNKTYCSVPHCRKYATPDVPMHFFPKIKSESQKWQQVLKIRKPITPYMVVCGRHFHSNDYIKRFDQKLARLKKGSVPSMNLPIMSREAGKSVQTRLKAVAEDHAKMMFLFCPKDRIIRNECMLKLKTKISGLEYTPSDLNVNVLDPKTIKDAEKRLAELQKQHNNRIKIKQEEISDDETEGQNNFSQLTYKEIQLQEVMNDLKEDELLDGYCPLTLPDTKPSQPSEPQIVKNNITDYELVKVFLTNATLIRKFLKNDDSIEKYLKTSDQVRKMVNMETKSYDGKPQDDCTTFGEFVAEKLRRMSGKETRQQFQDWIHKGISIIENVNVD